MILKNTIFANGIGNTMKRLGGECCESIGA